MGKIAYGALGAAIAVAAVGFGEERSEPGSSADTYSAIATTGSNILQTGEALTVGGVQAVGSVAGESVTGLQGVIAPLAAQPPPPTSAGLPAGSAPAAGQ